MSGGIWGIIHADGKPVDRANAHAMSDALNLRGPDGENIWHNGGTALGFRQLHTTPEAEHESLPWHDPASGVCITADARLDDRPHLIDAIGADRLQNPVITDGNLILQAYLKWGTDCVNHLIGDFAFAIWDERNRRLFCARDHLGVKPFYYYHRCDTFIFCSEAWVIAHHAGIAATLNDARIGDYLTPHLEGIDKISTFFNEILRLPPSHYATVDSRGLTISCYWQPTPGEIWHAKDDEYRDALEEVLLKAINDRCRGSAAPAVLLSGGIDSAAIAAMAGRLRISAEQGPVHTYSGISRSPGCLETAMIRRIADVSGTVSHHFAVDDFASWSDDLFSVLGTIQEPFDFKMVMTILLFRQAALNGHRFILDGVDGDVALSLSLSYPVFLFRNALLARGLTETISQSRDYYGGYFSSARLLFTYLRSAWTPAFFKRLINPLRINRHARTERRNAGICNDFARRINFDERLQKFSVAENARWGASHLDSYVRRLNHPLLTAGLERYDRIASICSIESRHPLLDKRIVDLFCSLPWDQFVRNGWTKYLFRCIAKQYVPEEICWRSGKEHLGSAFTTQLLEQQRKKILHAISDNYYFVINRLVFSLSDVYNCDNRSNHFTMLSKCAGLVLWLSSSRGTKSINEQHSPTKEFDKKTL